MATDTELDAIRNEAYQKIGRAVVLYQKYEALLKYLAVNQDLGGPLKDLPQIVAAKTDQVSMQSMGILVEQVHKSLYSQLDDADDRSPQSQDILVSTSFRIEAAQEVAVERKETLRRLVKERNELIHQRLAKLNLGSEESCRSLIADLDREWDGLRVEFETLRGLVRTLIEGRKESLEQLLEEMGVNPAREDTRAAGCDEPGDDSPSSGQHFDRSTPRSRV